MPTEDSGTSPFSQRVIAHPRIAHEGGVGGVPVVLAVRDQLLVCSSILPGGDNPSAPVAKWLHAIHAERLTTMLSGLDQPRHTEDVVLYRIPHLAHESIFDVVRRIRGVLPAGDQGKVSPNHAGLVFLEV